MKNKIDVALIEYYFIKIIAYCKICLGNFEDLYPIILRFHEIDKFRIMIYNAKLEQGDSFYVT